MERVWEEGRSGSRHTPRGPINSRRATSRVSIKAEVWRLFKAEDSGLLHACQETIETAHRAPPKT